MSSGISVTVNVSLNLVIGLILLSYFLLPYYPPPARARPTNALPSSIFPKSSANTLNPPSANANARTSLISPMSTYHRRGSVLSVAPSIISNAPSTASGSSTSDAPSDSTHRRIKLERLRRKLGDATAVFPTTPRTAPPRKPKTSTSTPSTRPADAHAPSLVVPPR
ncbi:hypothetical protein OG21DRAFT_1488446 [Imleria badia]|nr:hypothetical protein OG21DRAFT_1488446 [Imleria badia]